MKSFLLIALAVISMGVHAAEPNPACSALVVANMESPLDTDLLITISNTSKTPINLLVPNDIDDQFQILNIMVRKTDGTLVEESAKAKAVKTRLVSTGSSTDWTIAGAQKHEITIPLSEYFVLPAQGGYTVTAAADNLVGVSGKVVPINFKATKAIE